MTIDSQVSFLREYAAANNYYIDESAVYIENGFSGAYLERPVLDALRDRAAIKRDLDKILVLSPDRLARKHAHQLVLVEELKRLGVEIIFANHVITKTPEDQLLLHIQGVIAEFEREKILERSRRGKLFKAKIGKISVMGGAPYGYFYIRKGSDVDARYEINPKEAEVVKTIFDLYVNKRISKKKIAGILTENKIPTAKGLNAWCPSTVGVILKNSTYAGKAAYLQTKSVEITRKRFARTKKHFNRPRIGRGKRDLSERIYIPAPAIIDENLFKKAAEQANENYRCSKRAVKYQYLCRGLLTCQYCGYSYYGRMRKPADGTKHNLNLGYYECLGRYGSYFPDKKSRCSQGKPVRVDVLDDLVWDRVKKMLQDPNCILQEYEKRVSNAENEPLSIDKILGQKYRELSAKEKEREKLIDLYQCDMLTKSELETRITGVNLAIKQRKEEISSLQDERDQMLSKVELIHNLSTFTSKFNTNLNNLGFEEKSRIVNLVVRQIKVDGINKSICMKHVIPLHKKCQLQPLTALSICPLIEIPS
jgi:site-specific DNA recombinase